MTQALKPDHSHPGATQALSLSTIAFTVCFAVWTIFSIIGIRIKDELGLTETEFGLLIGMPILTGSLVRMLLGIWTDRYGDWKDISRFVKDRKVPTDVALAIQNEALDEDQDGDIDGWLSNVESEEGE